MGNGTIDANGLFQGTSPGMATVRATLGAISGSTSVSIEAPDQGYGAWLSGKYQGYIDAIVAYNNSQADPAQRILYLFPEWGYINFAELSVKNRFGENGGEGPASSVSRFYDAAPELADLRVYSLLSGTFDLGSLESSQIESLADAIAEAFLSDPYGGGLHLQIEPPASLPIEKLEAFYGGLAGAAPTRGPPWSASTCRRIARSRPMTASWASARWLPLRPGPARPSRPS